jgi:hypothetical protein
MSDLELVIADSLDRIFPVPVITANWDDVLDALTRPPPGGSRQRLDRSRRRDSSSRLSPQQPSSLSASALSLRREAAHAEGRMSRAVDGSPFR